VGWDGRIRRPTRPLTADAVLEPTEGDKIEQTPEGLIEYADQAYVALRLLMIASEATHPGALYHAGQVVEKYLKAVLLSRRWTVKDVSKAAKPRGHNLVGLAEAAGEEFADGEFIELCRRLMLFETAGRYPDHDLMAWEYSLELLTVIDDFVVHCRRS